METGRRSNHSRGSEGHFRRERIPVTRNLDRTLSEYHLTDREFTVLELLCEGCSDREIATTLRVTMFTVNKHVGSILSKMNVRSRTAAAVYAIRQHLIEDVRPGKPLRLTG